MAVTYDWTISDCDYEVSTGGINVVHWHCAASETVGEDTYAASNYGTVSLTPDPSSPDFVPYADVTKTMAQGWVWNSVSQEDTEAALAANIENQKNPTEASGNPWDAS